MALFETNLYKWLWSESVSAITKRQRFIVSWGLWRLVYFYVFTNFYWPVANEFTEKRRSLLKTNLAFIDKTYLSSESIRGVNLSECAWILNWAANCSVPRQRNRWDGKSVGQGYGEARAAYRGIKRKQRIQRCEAGIKPDFPYIRHKTYRKQDQSAAQ